MPNPADLVLMLNENARAQLREAMDQGYHRIVCGGGDSQGYHERLEFRVSELAVDVYDFAPA
ncbi:MAG: hypothetical protein QGH45_02025 [Myxococcota bacterium]|jgi:hypothetical protein|nr:hypothetical protein [Myxococcota bacterium]